MWDRTTVVVAISCAMLLSAACGTQDEAPQPSTPRPMVVIGVDGGEWSVVETLWEQGELQNLKRLAERGVTAELETDYMASPIIWTTIATGVIPERHGIEGFFLTEEGRPVPVTSGNRKVPALWNMVSSVGRTVAALGWWATWPAETVNGIIVSDRCLRELDGAVSPPEFQPRFTQIVERASGLENRFVGAEQGAKRDHVMTHTAVDLAADPHDLVLLYYRSPDQASHWYWKYFNPQDFQDVKTGEIEEFGDLVPQAYRAFDEAVGRVVAAYGDDVNYLLISDHGFESAHHEQVKIRMDVNTILEALGHLRREGDAIDFAHTSVYSPSPPDHHPLKALRFALAGREPSGTVRENQKAAVRARLERDFQDLTYATGEPVLRLAEPPEQLHPQADKADFWVEVLTHDPTYELRFRDETIHGATKAIEKVSGVHWSNPPGMFIAAGPDIDTTVDLTGIRVHDITPTVLVGLGLPVARDFDGRGWDELYTPAFRAAHPRHEISTWGLREGTAESTSSEVDDELMDELRALGYIE